MIRRATQADHPWIAQLATEVYRDLGDYGQVMPQWLVQPGVLAWLDEDAGQRRGFAVLEGVIAETGSLALSARHPGARRGAFLAETHFALAADDCVVERLADLLARLAPDLRARAGHSLTLIAGPSRTADIEKTLVLGAHGPRRLVLATAPAALLRGRFAPGVLPPEASP